MKRWSLRVIKGGMFREGCRVEGGYLVAPLFQEDVYIIMWQSPKRGGTYTEVRRSEEGMNRLVRSLEYVGYQPIVTRQKKPWIPERKTKQKSRKVQVDE